MNTNKKVTTKESVYWKQSGVIFLMAVVVMYLITYDTVASLLLAAAISLFYVGYRKEKV